MRLLFVADGRSPTTQHWLHYWLERGDEVHLISTFSCTPLPGLASFQVIPVAFNRMSGGRGTASPQMEPRLVSRVRGYLLPLRYVLGPLSLTPNQRRFQQQAAEIAPDIIHALRIPFEGMLTAATPRGVPLIVSIWGNDITLHAHGSFLMNRLTRQTLQRANGLISDTRRDIRLGQEWGFCGPTLVVPGGGGIQADEIRVAAKWLKPLPEKLPEVPLVVNPRGQRPGSLRQDVFFQAIPRVLKKIPQAVFICPPLAGDAKAGYWVNRLGIQANVKLWPLLTQMQLWSVFRKAQVFVSPSIHDGTPNSMLEAMACGCFPVVGDIESMREWIIPGVNGLLVNATNPQALAEALIAALSDPDLRSRAAKENARRITERADYRQCMALAEAFYQRILENGSLLPEVATT